jgi:5-methylthioadenosine/S-adenosylhomocysteine deaminase
MPAVPADLSIKARWIVPMTGRDEVLDHHTLVMRDGRILDVLPSAAATELYDTRVVLERPAHLVLPGFVNALTQIGSLGPSAGTPRFLSDAGLLCIANMLKAGITCFCHVGRFPRDAAQLAAAQGLRAVIGLPVAQGHSPWAQNAAEYVTRALQLRDEYKGHSAISAAFALLEPGALSDATYARIATLANELDAGILTSLHASQHEIEESLSRYGVRPIERLEALGLLTPALTAAHMVHLSDADLELAQRRGIGVTLCLASDLQRGAGVARVADLAAAGLRLSLGCDGSACRNDQDIWTAMKLMALHAAPALTAWDTLAAATRGGAAVLGLEAEIGSLERGKWADVCCIDMGGPATQPTHDPIGQLVFSGGRDMVSDVWVAGRQLLSDGEFTRLDWPSVAARLDSGRSFFGG